jgi:hypothetical protein
LETRPKQKKEKFPCGGTIFWEQIFRVVTPKGPFLKRYEGGLGQVPHGFFKEARPDFGPFGTECGKTLFLISQRKLSLKKLSLKKLSLKKLSLKKLSQRKLQFSRSKALR